MKTADSGLSIYTELYSNCDISVDLYNVRFYINYMNQSSIQCFFALNCIQI